MCIRDRSNLDDIFKEPSYDELKEALEAWLNPDSGDATTSTDARTTEEPKEEKAPAGVNKVDDVGAAFDELFND